MRIIGTMPTITFNTFDENAFKDFKPVLAKTVLPEWWKNTKVYQINGAGAGTQTLRGCPAMNDWLGMGWYIVAERDIHVALNGTTKTLEVDDPILTVSTFSNRQGMTSPSHPVMQMSDTYAYDGKEPRDAFKFRMPWNVRTPIGYSVLYLDPFLFSNPYYSTWHGVIDADTFNTNLDTSQLIMYAKSDQPFVIPAGSPICQIVPFKREEWNSEISLYSDKTRFENQSMDLNHEAPLSDEELEVVCPAKKLKDLYPELDRFPSIHQWDRWMEPDDGEDFVDIFHIFDSGPYKTLGYWKPKAKFFKKGEETPQLELDL